MDISIADNGADADALAKFFRANLTASYISHSELQSHRAIRPDEWAPDIERVLRDEIAARLVTPATARHSDAEWAGVVVGREAGRLVALALVTLSRNAAVPFGVLEDVVVHNARRDAGFGTRMIEWIIDDLRAAGARRMFLESGIHNEKAHQLFERLQFRPLSLVMMRDL